MANLINQDRSRRLVIKKMKDMGLISSTKDITRSRKQLNVRPPRDWSQDEISELTRLFDEVRDSSGDYLSVASVFKSDRSDLTVAVRSFKISKKIINK